MPWSLLWMLLWPTGASLLLAVLAWLVLRRDAPPLRAGRVATAVAVAVAVVVIVAHTVLGAAPLWIRVPQEMWSVLFGARFALPLVLALVLVVLLGAIRPRPATSAGAALVPRSWRTFVHLRWLIALAGVLVLIVGLTLAAGLASEPNEAGEYVVYRIDVGSMEMGTTIYGWDLSRVPVVLCALLCAVTGLALSRIARAPMSEDGAAEVADRRQRSTNTVRVALGALLLHLEAVLESLATTAGMTGSFSGDDVSFSTGTSFAALAGTLEVLAQVAGVLGLALWVFTVLTAVRAPLSARAARSPVAT